MIDARYCVEELVGRGTMGLVMRARDIALARTVAVKVMQHPSTGSMTASFYREGRTLAQLRHDNVVQVHAIGEHDGCPYIVMEHVAGQTLENIIEANLEKGGGTVPFTRAVEIIRRVAEGLAAVHAKGLIHRDVKPSNIMIEEGPERPVLVDFGLAARLSELDPKASLTGGTPCYMSPEQVRDPAAVCARSDIYSLACTMFELFTGRSVFTADSLMGLLTAHATHIPPLLSSLRPELFPLDGLLRRALAKTPANRHPSCADFLEAFEAAVARVHQRPSGIRVRPPIVTTADGKPCFAPLKAIVLQRADGLRRNVERALATALGASDGDVEIACLETELELFGAMKRSLPDIVVIDEERTSGRTEAMIEMLRDVAGPSALDVLVLVRNDTSTLTRLAQLDVLAVPKPVNIHVLRSVTSRLGRKIAERRSSAQRRFLFEVPAATETEPDLQPLMTGKGTAVIPTSY
jgi:serine/threonine-protein kinase